MAISLKDLQRGRDTSPPRIVLYGVPGIGKTTFAAQAPSPIFIQAESGLGNLDVPRFPVAQTYDDVISGLKAVLTEEHDFGTLVIDSLDAVEALVFAHTAKQAGKKNIEEIGYAKGYTLAVTHWEAIVSLTEEIRLRRQMAILALAHELVKTHTPPDGDAYDRYMLRLHKHSISIWFDKADVVLFANYRTMTKQSSSGKTQGLDHQGRRVLYTEERPSHLAKNRFNLPYELPFEKDTSFSTFAAALAEGRKS